MIVYGLTGGIACGKSAVTNYIRDYKIPVIDCDDISHNVLLPGHWGFSRALSAFQENLPLTDSGFVDRKKLGSIVFADRSLRKKLVKAVGLPIVVEIFRQLFLHWLSGENLVFIDAPTLYETKTLLKIIRRVVVVAVSPKIQLERLMKRDCSSMKEAKQRINAQMPVEEKVELADIVIKNEGSLHDLQRRVHEVVVEAKKEADMALFCFPSPLRCTIFISILLFIFQYKY